MIELNDSYGKKIFVSPSAISEILEAATAAQWHGVHAYVRTFDGRTIEVRERADEVAKLIREAK